MAQPYPCFEPPHAEQAGKQIMVPNLTATLVAIIAIHSSSEHSCLAQERPDVDDIVGPDKFETMGPDKAVL